jgi:DNA-binding NarL/FixJ family response regulator
MTRIRVLVAEDHETVRLGLRTLLASQADIDIVDEASDGEMAVECALRSRPEVVVLDLSMPRLNGIAAAQAITRGSPETRIVAFTRHGDDALVREFMASGAAGYVLKQSASTELLRAIREVASGRPYTDSALVARQNEEANAEPRGRRVTDRERNVLRLTAQGHSNKEIAGELGLSVKTIEVHKANAMRKLELRGRVDVVRYAAAHGWLDPH